ncbi:MAG TPA: hypothetical protein DGZ34_07420 [Lachnospiraceae bacterium]|nr:zinc ribbon domain-containing protein [Clostridium sp.]HCX92483.1 hypothetical protein [Lachnospiraceae bacterium]
MYYDKRKDEKQRALISCPECNREISDTVRKCPNCGYKIKNHRSKKELKLLKNTI